MTADKRRHEDATREHVGDLDQPTPGGGGRVVVLDGPRVYLTRRMAWAVRCLDWDGATVRVDVRGRRFLACEDLPGLRDRIMVERGTHRPALGDVATAVHDRIGAAR